MCLSHLCLSHVFVACIILSDQILSKLGFLPALESPKKSDALLVKVS